MPAIAYWIEQRLRLRDAGEKSQMKSHPDEDTITAFVEARLESAESSAVISHLVDCGECRHATAELVRLESEFGENEGLTGDDTPSRLGAFLSGLASQLVPSNEQEVFAYQNPETEPGETDESDPPADDVIPPKS